MTQGFVKEQDVTVTATDLDIRDLTQATDSVAVGDGTDTVEVAAFPASDGAALGNTLKTSNFNMMYNGTSWDRLRGSAANGLTVNLGTNNDVTITSGTITTITNDVNIADGGNSITVDDGGTSLTVDGTVGVSGTVTVDLGANNDVTATGNVAHDAADSGNPIKTGGKAFNYTTSTSGEIGQTAVAANDRVNQALTLRGETPIFLKAKYAEPTNIDTTYNNVTTTATSAGIDVNGYSQFVFGFELTESGTATDILIEVEVDLGDGNYKKLMNDWLGDWRFDDTSVSGGIEEAMYFRCTADNMRIKVTATGTDASNTFTMANSVLRCMV